MLPPLTVLMQTGLMFLACMILLTYSFGCLVLVGYTAAASASIGWSPARIASVLIMLGTAYGALRLIGVLWPHAALDAAIRGV